MITEARVLEALSEVRDPELDQPITDLRFVENVRIEGDRVHVWLRLPTYFCAPNFAYIMAADAQEATSLVDGVREVDVILLDHFASDEINEGMAGGRDFHETFPEDADASGLGELRTLFRRKAFIARQEKLCSSLLREGRTMDELAAMTLGDLSETEDARLYLDRRPRLFDRLPQTRLNAEDRAELWEVVCELTGYAPELPH